MNGALEGIRVLDCSQIIAGPLATSLLSEMGADVLKVEPLEGEPWRLQAEFIPKESKTFIAQNRGKRGFAIDLKRPESAPIRRKLVEWADVVVTNYRPGAAEQLGLDYDAVRAINSNVIYCENTAFGPKGPDARRRGYDIVAQAMSGLMLSNGVYDNGLPRVTSFAPADVFTGASMAWGITAALYHRQRTGEGQRVDVSLLLTALYIQAGFREVVAIDEPVREARLEALHAARERGAGIEEIVEQRRASMPELTGAIYYRTYRTEDGLIAVGCLGPGPRARFRKAVGIRDPRYEEGFDSSPANVAKVGAALVAEAERIFSERTSAEWLALLDANDVAAGPVRFVDELWDDPQVQANGYIAEFDHTLLGALRGAGPIVRMSASPTRVNRASPALGEHTEEMLIQFGFSPGEIDRLRSDGIIL